MQPWRTALATSDETNLWMGGYDVESLMRKGSFVDTIFLLQRGRLPSASERKLLDAILVSVADHGSGAPSCAAARLVASGNRQSLSAAIAAGVLAIGDEHGGAGSLCMEAIAEGLAMAKRESLSIEEAARKTWEQARAAGKRVPGLGHRVHSTDPRVSVLFDMEQEAGVPTEGAQFLRALEALSLAMPKPIPINVDGALAAVLYDLGFPPAAGKLMFIIGRVAGLAAEVAEEYVREKPMRIRIPVVYDGEPPRSME